MKNAIRAILSTVFLGFGAFCFIQGNPAWLVTMGFTDWTMPAIFVVLGLGLGVIAALSVIPFSEEAPTARV